MYTDADVGTDKASPADEAPLSVCLEDKESMKRLLAFNAEHFSDETTLLLRSVKF